MSYDPKTKLYYLKNNEAYSENNRIVPAPQLSLTPEYYYANDIAIGYTYNVNLNGYATPIDLREETPQISSVSGVIENVQYIKNLFNGNGGTLLLLDPSNQTIARFIGGTVRSLNFAESDNSLVNFAPYTCSIEFNEIELGDCEGIINVDCSTLPSGINSTESPELIDMKLYKVKSFNDSWTFELSDQIYSSYNFSEESGQFHNEYLTATYTINCTGKHYFVDDKLLPAWEQAKNFVQKRLRDKVSALPNQILTRKSSEDLCVAEQSLSDVFGSGNDYLLDELNTSDFGIYNEKISCETSEAEGSFTATYSCIIKRKITDDIVDPDVLHTISVVKTINNDNKTGKVTTISVDGSIQGLLPAGFIDTDSNFELPTNGQFIITSTPTTSKYDNAWSAYQKVGTSSQLLDDYKRLLGITFEALGAEGECLSDELPQHTSHSLTHNYKEGIVTYKTEFDTTQACLINKSYRNIVVTIQDKIPITVEHIVPGRADGPIIQRIDVDRPKKISIAIDGVLDLEDCCYSMSGLVNCEADNTIADIPAFDTTGLKLTEDKFTKGQDGSYSINRTYICCEG